MAKNKSSILDDLDNHSLGNKGTIKNTSATQEEGEAVKSASSILSDLDNHKVGTNAQYTQDDEVVTGTPIQQVETKPLSTLETLLNNGATYGNRYANADTNHNLITNLAGNLAYDAANGTINTGSAIGRLANNILVKPDVTFNSVLNKDYSRTAHSDNAEKVSNAINDFIVNNNNIVKENKQAQQVRNEEEQNKAQTEFGKNVIKVAQDVSSSIGNMAPTIAANALTGGAAGLTPLFLSSYGGNLVDKTDENGNVETKENIRALLGASIEVITEKMFGANTLIGGRSGLSKKIKEKFTDKLIGYVTKKIGSAATKVLIDQLENAFEEGAEEFIGTYMNAYVDNILDNNDYNVLNAILDKDTTSEAFYSGLVGGLTGVIMETPTIKAQYNAYEAQNKAMQEAVNKAIEQAQTTKQVINQQLSNEKIAQPQINENVQAPLNNVQIDSNLLNRITPTQMFSDNTSRSLQPELYNNIVDGYNNGITNQSMSRATNLGYGNQTQEKTANGITALQSDANRILSKDEIVNAGVMNDTEYNDLVKRTKNLGLDLTFTYDTSENASNGSFSGNTVNINLGGYNPYAQVWVHEITHSLEGTPEYEALKKQAFESMNKTGNVDKGRNILTTKYANEYNSENVDQELVARYMEKVFTDQETINELYAKEPNLFERILNWIKERLGIATSQKEKTDLQKAAELYENALNNKRFNVNESRVNDTEQNYYNQMADTEAQFQEAEYSNGNESIDSLIDSDGNKLSKQQQEYFKDSKVRDENGNLVVMYHGSESYGFTVFDAKKARRSGTYGNGFYFGDESTSNVYGKQYEVYLNITNPLTSDTYNITNEQLYKFVNELANNEDYGIYNYGSDATVDSVVKSLEGKSDFAKMLDLNASCVGNMVEAIKLFNDVNGTNYDGIIAPTETVAFYPEQIKNVDNTSPTTNEDIRYSKGNETIDQLLSTEYYNNWIKENSVNEVDKEAVKNVRNLGILTKAEAERISRDLRSFVYDTGYSRVSNKTLKRYISKLVEQAGTTGMTDELLNKYFNYVVTNADYQKAAIKNNYVSAEGEEMFNYIKNSPVKMTDFMLEGKNEDDAYNSHHIQKTKNGMKFADWVADIDEQFPNMFGVHESKAEADLYQEIADFMDNYSGGDYNRGDLARATEHYKYDTYNGVFNDDEIKANMMDFLKNGTQYASKYTQEKIAERQAEYEAQQKRKEAIAKEKDIEEGIWQQSYENDLYMNGSEEDIEAYEREKARKANKEYVEKKKTSSFDEALEAKKEAMRLKPKEFGVNMDSSIYSHLTNETEDYLAKTVIEADEGNYTNYHTMQESKRIEKVKNGLNNQSEWYVPKSVKAATDLMSFRTPQRNAIKLFGKTDGKFIIDNYVNKVVEHEHDSINALKEIKAKYGEALQYVYDNYDTIVDDYLDGGISEDELLNKSDTKAVESAKKMRNGYKDMYEAINKALIDAGLDPIPYVTQYTPHLDSNNYTLTESDFDGFLKMVCNKLGIADEGDTINLSTVNGVYEQQRKYMKNSFWALKSREGESYSNKSAALKFELYAEKAQRLINHTQDIQNFKTLAETISGKNQQAFDYKVHQLNDELANGYIGATDFTRRFNTLQAEYNGNNLFPAQVEWANRYAELLTTGSTKHINDALGGKYFNDNIKKSFNKVHGILAKNMIAYNLTSAVNNLQPLLQAAGVVSQHNLIRGMQESASNTFKNDGYTYKSSFLTNLYGKEAMFDTHTKESFGDKGFKLMEMVDQFAKPAIHRGFYYDAIENGMSEEQAIKYADEKTSALVADRSFAQMPEAFYSNSPLMKMATAFQLEQFNILEWYTKDLPSSIPDKDKKKLVENLMRALIGTSVAAFCYNYVFKKLFGYDSAFSPVDTIHDIYEEVTSDDSASDKAKETIGIAIKDVPIASTLYNNIFDTNEKRGNLFPVQSALPTKTNVEHIVTAIQNFNDENVSDEEAKEYMEDVVLNDLSKLLYLVPGGSQIRKSAKGIHQYNEGVNDKYGTTKYNVDQNAYNAIVSLLGGESAVPEAQDYYSRDLKKAYTTAQELEKNNNFSIDSFYEIYDQVKDVKADKNAKGNAITNSKSLKMRKQIDDYTSNITIRRKLYEAFGVSNDVAKMNTTQFNEAYRNAKSKIGK